MKRSEPSSDECRRTCVAGPAHEPTGARVTAKKRWADLSANQRAAIIVAGAAEVVLTDAVIHTGSTAQGARRA